MTSKPGNSDIGNFFSSIFPLFHEIYAPEGETIDGNAFKNRIADARNSLSADKSYLEDKGVLLEYDSLDTVPEGRFTVMRDGVRMESMFITCPGSERLFVVLGGARTRNGGRDFVPLPQLNMWSWSNRINVNYLYIEDPLYYVYNDPPLKVGWFFGTGSADLRRYVGELVNKIASIKGFSGNNIKIYGISAGGSAALPVAGYVKGCTAIANNPQLDFARYYQCPRFTNITGVDIIAESVPGGRNDIIGQLLDSEADAIIMINAYSVEDTELHLDYLVKRTGFRPRLGLNRITDHLTLWLYAVPGAMSDHTTSPSESLMLALFWLSDKLQQGGRPEDYQELFLLFNNFFFAQYSAERRRQTDIADLKAKIDSLSNDNPMLRNPNLENYITARIDIKNSGSDGNNIEITSNSDENSTVTSPEWLNQNGGGVIVHSTAGSLDLSLRCKGKGSLNVTLRGKYLKSFDGATVPLFVDYTRFELNGEALLSEKTPISHDRNKRFTHPVSDGDIITLHFSWVSHDPRV